MAVRPLRDEADVRELLVAHAQAWRAAYTEVLPAAVVERVADEDPDDDRVAAEADRLSDYDDGRVLVYEDDDGTVCGYAVFRWGENETKASVDEGEAELKELYVEPARWGRGIGTALLEAGIDRLPDDVDALSLEALEGNEVGIGFYERRGFDHVGDDAFEVDGGAYPTRVYRRPLE